MVLGGDSPISFEKALGEEGRRPRRAPGPAAQREPTEAEIKYERRDAQRAALDERERLRALFESAKPLDEDGRRAGRCPPSRPTAPAPAPRPRQGPPKPADRALTAAAEPPGSGTPGPEPRPPNPPSPAPVQVAESRPGR